MVEQSNILDLALAGAKDLDAHVIQVHAILDIAILDLFIEAGLIDRDEAGRGLREYADLLAQLEQRSIGTRASRHAQRLLHALANSVVGSPERKRPHLEVILGGLANEGRPPEQSD